MASLNRVIVLGNLGADPELRYTQNQTAVCTLSVATTDFRNSPDGQRQEFTEWHRIVVWGRQAENCSKYLTKGRSVMIEGRLQTRAWEDKQGQKRYTTEIVAQNVQFMGGGQRDRSQSDYGARENNSSGDYSQNNQGAAPVSGAQGAQAVGIGGPETAALDDIPF